MPGTREGGLKAAKTIKKKDPDHYAKAGAKGGAARTKKGFAAMTDAERKKINAKGGKAKKQR